MNNYLLSTTSGEEGYTEVKLEDVIVFPVNLSSEELWDKVAAKAGEARANDYFFRAWTGMTLNHSDVSKRGKYVISTEGGYSSEPGDFVGYAKGEVVSLGGPACLWDSESSDAEFTHAAERRKKAIFAVCRTRGNSFWLHEVHDEGYLRMAEALGVSLDDLLIA